MDEEIDIEISADRSDADWQAIKAIVKTKKIEGPLELWALNKFIQIYRGTPIDEVFDQIMRARQKDKRAMRDIDIINEYRDRRLNTDLTHEAIRREVASIHKVGEETVKKLWTHWGKFL